MRDAFHEVLDNISDDLIEMIDLAADALTRATTALLDADLDLAENVIAADEALDALEKKINVVAVDTLARQQPVATDLRIIVTALRMAASIERMGDLAAHVCKIARMHQPSSAVPEGQSATVTRMSEIAIDIARGAAELIAAKNAEGYHELDRTDDELDRLNRELIALTKSDDAPFSREAGIDLAMLARFYERYADHAISAARSVGYLVTGELHLHHVPE